MRRAALHAAGTQCLPAAARNSAAIQNTPTTSQPRAALPPSPAAPPSPLLLGFRYTLTIQKRVSRRYLQLH